jgi:DAK2 domain
MANNSALLTNIFQQVTNTLVENQKALDLADDQNHDHGTNMVKTFQTITSSIEKKQDLPPSDALAYASKQVSKQTASGSGQMYAQGLANAATQLKGQTINPQSAIQLLQTLIGGGQAAQQQPTQSGGGDLLGSLLGELTGGGQATPQQPAQSGGGDLLGSLLGELSGGGQTAPQQPAQSGSGDLLGSLLGGLTGGGNSQATTGGGQAGTGGGLDVGDLINAGMAFMQAKQSGNSTAGALLQAVLAGSGMGNTTHRQQSTQLVASSFLQALGSLTGK